MNYVNIEITKMLPPNLHNDWTNAWWIPSKYYGQDAVEQFGEWVLSSRIDLVNEDEEVYKAWTHEEVRLWLQQKGYFISIETFGDEKDYPKYQYFIQTDYNSKLQTIMKQLSMNYEEQLQFCFKTYEEARNEGIIECLKMINDDNTRIDKT